ncbi:unnamed protein product, partial [Meganyctiphanes norvegica]
MPSEDEREAPAADPKDKQIADLAKLLGEAIAALGAGAAHGHSSATVGVGEEDLGTVLPHQIPAAGMMNHSGSGSSVSSGMVGPTGAMPHMMPQHVSDIKSEPDDPEKGALVAVLQFLKKNGLRGTEELLRRESQFFEEVEDPKPFGGPRESFNVLSTYKNEGDPAEYEDAYKSLQSFVDKSLDAYKHEASLVLYPVFVHMYLELVYNEHSEMAKSFCEKFGHVQEDYYQEDIIKLAAVMTRDHMNGYQIMDTFRASQFTVRMSRDSYSNLKRYLSERGIGPVPRIIQNNAFFILYNGAPSIGNGYREALGSFECVNKAKMFYGLLKEIELPNVAIEEEEEGEGEDKPKKKKPKKDALQKSKKNDPNAPSTNRIPLPELRDVDIIEKGKIMRDSLKRVTLSKDMLPSICFYTFLNAVGNVTCCDISDDSSLLANGTSDSQVRVHSITPAKLRAMKSVDNLEDIDKDADDVLVRMMDERTAETVKVLQGHSGPVNSCSFSPDRSLLLTAGEDGTIRLWSLQTWTCLVSYKGHVFPVWSVRFSPHGYYFASGGGDRTARLWTTDQHQPLRIFSGHFSDVDIVDFHPNSNYIASGSSDRSVRVWDNLNGNCVRVLTGHKGSIFCLAFSPCGRYLSSSGADKRVLVWDLAQGNLLAEMSHHQETVYAVAFSRESNMLASGGMDNLVCLWDFAKVLEDNHEDGEVNISQQPQQQQQQQQQSPMATGGSGSSTEGKRESLLLRAFPTKNTPVLGLHFTRRNVLLATGPYDG